MALTASEKLSIATIIGVTPSLLDARLTSLGASLDDDRETAVRAELERWVDAGTQFVKIHPKESNMGVETDSGNAKADIKRNLAILLEFPVSIYSMSGIGTIQVGI